MQIPDPTFNQTGNTLMITHEIVVQVICFAIKTDGVETAQKLFDTLNANFSIVPGWSATALAIRKLFANLKEEQQKKIEAEKEADRKQAEQKSATPSVVMVNNNEATAEKISNLLSFVDQLNGVIEDGAEVIHTKHN